MKRKATLVRIIGYLMQHKIQLFTVLILDDSSSALDYKTDARFRSALGDSYDDTTTIIIAQRISSIMHCDKILVLEDGHPLGLGTHEELMKSCDAYREISEIQMGGGEA